MEVSARPAVPADAGVLADLVDAARHAVGGERGGDPWLATDAPDAPGPDDLTAVPGGRRWWVGCIDGVPVGVAAASAVRWRDARTVLRIELLYVDPGAREVGVGEALVDAVLAAAADDGAAGVEGVALPGQRELKNLYERVGLVARAIVAFRAVTPA